MGLDARSMESGGGLILAVAILAGAGCADLKEPAVSSSAGGGSSPIQETQVRKWVEYRGGRIAWEFRGDRLRYYENPERVEADQVIIDFYDDDEEYSSTLLADHGEIDQKSSDMRAWGSVVLTNVEGTRLETESIEFRDKEEKIFTDDFVSITKGKQKITGYGLETDPHLNETLIKRDVVAVTDEAIDG